MDDVIKEVISKRRQGLRQEAIKFLEDYCLENPGDLDMVTTLKVWKKELVTENWTMSRRDSNRSSCEEDFGPWSKLINLWSYKFPAPFTQKSLPDIPSPIIANDMVIVPNSTLQSFVGLRISDGHCFLSPEILGGRLSYASTPLYLNPFLIFALNGGLYQISFGQDKLSLSSSVSDRRIELISYCAPMIIKETAVFGFRGWIFLYKPKTGEIKFIPYKLKKENDTLLSPVGWEEEMVFLSRFGQLCRLRIDEFEQAALSIEDIDRLDGSVCSAPSLVKDRLYFESLGPEGVRNICEYSLSGEGGLRMEGLEEGLCSQEDTHLYFPPIVFQDGVIVSSDIGPCLYYVQGGYSLRITPIDIRVQEGNLRVYQTSHIFAFVLGNNLISKFPKGFFSVNLANPEQGTIDIFRPPTEIIAQLISYSRRVFFMTKVGVKCYVVR